MNDRAAMANAAIPPPSANGPAACFYPRQVQNFRVLDRSNLIVYTPNDANAYQVRINPPSNALPFAESLAFLPANDRICGYAGERLIVGLGAAADRVAVIDVARLTPASLAILRASSAGETVPSAHPQPGPGADIEGAAPDQATGKPAEQPVENAASPTKK